MIGAVARVHVDAAPDAAVEAVTQTVASIARCLRRRRRLRSAMQVLVVTPDAERFATHVNGWSRAVHTTVGVCTPEALEDDPVNPETLLITCIAGEILDPRLVVAAIRLIRESGPRVVVHPRYLALEGVPGVMRLPDSAHDSLTLEALLDADPWPGVVVTTGVVAAELAASAPSPALPFESRRRQWTLAALAAQIPQRTVQALALLPLPLAARSLIDVDVRELERALVDGGPRVPAATGAWDQHSPTSSRLVRLARRGGRGLLRRARALLSRRGDRAAQRRMARRLSMADGRHGTTSARSGTSADGAYRYGRLLAQTWRSLQGVDTLIVTSRISTRSSDQVALHYAHALAETHADSRRIALVTSPPRAETDSGIIPRSIVHYPLPDEFVALDACDQASLLVQLAVLSHVQELIFVDAPCAIALPSLRSARSLGPRVAVHSSSWTRPAEPASANPADGWFRVVAEGKTAAALLAEQLRGSADEAVVNGSPVLPVIPDFETVGQYTAAYDDELFDEQHPFRALWRTTDGDGDDRRALVEELRRLIEERGLPVAIEPHHEVGVSAAASEDIAYDYTGGLLNVPTENYHCLLLGGTAPDTRATVAQAFLLGLPVISTQTSVDADLIDDATALIVEDSAQAIVDGIEALATSRSQRRRIARAAYSRGRALHDPERFRSAVHEMFLPTTRHV